VKTTDSSDKSKWDKRYMDLAIVAASWSKDPSTKIGAVAIGEKGQVLCTGYNGFPRGIDDNLTRYYNRELKYKMVVHAEQNAIYNATYNGVSLNGSTMYVHGLPCCSDCAKGIIQVGVKRVIMSTPATPDRWKDSWQLTETMFKEAGVSYDFIE
jgi:dCMP deaminase